MPRQKPTSTTHKKADQKLKRAVKRGDIAPPEKTHKRKAKFDTGPPVPITSETVSARKLQSAFVKLPKEYLQETKLLAASIHLDRPISPQQSILPNFQYDVLASKERLTCPRRPQWRFDMTKKEVESNEEGLFKKWLDKTDGLVERWRNDGGSNEETQMPRSWSYFERNLDVWRQLWRVTEISQIILVLLDSRCPLVHYPLSLRDYLSGSKVILVLTKVDISGSERTAAWTSYLRDSFPGVRIVHVESYREKATNTEQKARNKYESHIPMEFRTKLVETIRELHSELLQPIEKVKVDEASLRKWKPPVKQVIDWAAVMNAQGNNVGAEISETAPAPTDTEVQDTDETERPEPEFLTIGLIGQPNVGKSSLLNALFGTRRVSTSKTPGRTKHFQTLFWTHDIRVVDCPGLVMPSYVPMEMQVLSGILPISRMSAIAACIHYACRYLPLEQILRLSHPDLALPPVEDKRTWRDGTSSSHQKEKLVHWTAMDVLTAYADLKGWMTAQAGRPDVNRAGNAILRALAEGRIAWTFWPPNVALEDKLHCDGSGNGIWIPQPVREDTSVESEDNESVGGGHEQGASASSHSGDTDDEDDSEKSVHGAVSRNSRFAALNDIASDVEARSSEGED